MHKPKINKTKHNKTNKINKKTNIKKNKNKTSKTKGGKIIGSGGYGCVFRPALKCKDESSREPNKISKLMKNDYAENEYKEIIQFLPILKKIPNYASYFLVEDITLCKPDKLSEDDLENFKNKCKPSKKLNMTSENINEHLDELQSLNMPDGGINVGDYVDDEKPIDELNQMLIDLLVNGIIPMNQLDVYHADVKESNILVGKDQHARLIDWGLSYKTNGSSVPKIFSKKPLQYNVPFSSILFNTTFVEMYKEFNPEKTMKSEKQIKSFVRNYLYEWNDERGEGHLKLINKLIKLTTEKSGTTVIIDYLSEIIIKYTQPPKKYWLMDYFKNIFLKNLDVWGLIMSYSPILEKTKDPKLKKIFADYLYDPTKAGEVINVDELVESLLEKGIKTSFI